MLLSSRTFAFYPHLIIIRDAAGHWVFYVRTYSNESAAKHIRVKLSVFCANSSGVSPAIQSSRSQLPQFSLCGPLLSRSLSPDEFSGSSSYLSLNDGQVQALSYNGNLLNFSVEFLFSND